VLTGGGALLEGMPEIAEQIFDLPVRRAAPEGVGGLADHVNNPAFAASVGVALYAHRNLLGEPVRMGAGAFGRLTGRLRTLFKEFF
jgi:cell division protein FtsA